MKHGRVPSSESAAALLFFKRKLRMHGIVVDASYLDAGTSALADSVRDGCSRGVNHGHQPHEGQVFKGEIDIIGVELESGWELFRGKILVCEACNENDNSIGLDQRYFVRIKSAKVAASFDLKQSTHYCRGVL